MGNWVYLLFKMDGVWKVYVRVIIAWMDVEDVGILLFYFRVMLLFDL